MELTTQDWVRDRLGGYVRMGVDERREAVAELAEDGLSQHEIAAVVGVGVGTVNRDINVPNGTPDDDLPPDSADQEDPTVPFGTPDPADRFVAPDPEPDELAPPRITI
jgi:hypothetical protein